MQLFEALRAFVGGAQASIAAPLLVSFALLAALFTWQSLVRIRSRGAPERTDPDTLPGAVEEHEEENQPAQDEVPVEEAHRHDEPPKRHAQTEHHHRHHHHRHAHHTDSSRASSSSSSSGSRSNGEAKQPRRAKTDLVDSHPHDHKHHHHHQSSIHHNQEVSEHHQHHRGHTQHAGLDDSHREHESRILPFEGKTSFLCAVILARADGSLLATHEEPASMGQHLDNAAPHEKYKGNEGRLLHQEHRRHTTREPAHDHVQHNASQRHGHGENTAPPDYSE